MVVWQGVAEDDGTIFVVVNSKLDIRSEPKILKSLIRVRQVRAKQVVSSRNAPIEALSVREIRNKYFAGSYLSETAYSLNFSGGAQKEKLTCRIVLTMSWWAVPGYQAILLGSGSPSLNK